MWYRYAACGVAVRSEYGRLKAAIAKFLDDVHVGKVRYGDEEMTGYTPSKSCSLRGTTTHGRTRSGLSCVAMTRWVDRLAITARRTSRIANLKTISIRSIRGYMTLNVAGFS